MMIETLEKRQHLNSDAIVYVGWRSRNDTAAIAPLEGVEAWIDYNDNGRRDVRDKTATTNSKGLATFKDLRGGTYTVHAPSMSFPFLDAENPKTTVTLPRPPRSPNAPWGIVWDVLFTTDAQILIVRDYPPLNVLEGNVFFDKDQDGSTLDRLGPNDGGIAGVRIYLDINENGVREKNEPSSLTNAEGHYQLRGMSMLEMNSSIRITAPSGYINTTPTRRQGKENTTQSFGLFKQLETSRINIKTLCKWSAVSNDAARVSVYLDLNRDGNWDTDEPRQKMSLDGSAFFYALPGKYRIRVSVPPTLKVDRRFADIKVGDRQSRTRSFTFAGAITTYASFFHDINKNHRRDSGEPLLRYGDTWTVFSSVEYTSWKNEPYSLKHDSNGLIKLVDVPGSLQVSYNYFLSPNQTSPLFATVARPGALPIDSVWELPVEYIPPFWSGIEISGT